MNETYDGDELIAQDFEMIGNGTMVLREGYSEGDYEEGFTAEISVSSATVNRSWQDDELSERIMIEGNGWLSFNGGDNNVQVEDLMKFIHSSLNHWTRTAREELRTLARGQCINENLRSLRLLLIRAR